MHLTTPLLFILVAVVASSADSGELRVKQLGVSQPPDAVSVRSLNSIIDNLLTRALIEIQSQSLSQVPLPDFVERFTKRVGISNMKGKLTGSYGFASPLASLARRGDVTHVTASTTPSGPYVEIEAALGFGELKAQYQYIASLGHVKKYGQVNTFINSSAVLLRANVSVSDEFCSAAVTCLELTDLSSVRVKTQSLDQLFFLYDRIVTWVTTPSRLHDPIRDAVRIGLRDAIGKAGQKFRCGP